MIFYEYVLLVPGYLSDVQQEVMQDMVSKLVESELLYIKSLQLMLVSGSVR